MKFSGSGLRIVHRGETQSIKVPLSVESTVGFGSRNLLLKNDKDAVVLRTGAWLTLTKMLSVFMRMTSLNRTGVVKFTFAVMLMRSFPPRVIRMPDGMKLSMMVFWKESENVKLTPVARIV